jgi:hypothetical protein
MNSCEDCPPGKFSQAGASDCIDCEAGRFQSDPGKSSCDACSVGTFSAELGSTACDDCAPGTAQRASGQASCEPCAKGTFAASSGSSSCLSCDGNRDSVKGARKCDRCQPKYFLESPSPRNVTCAACPDNAVCQGGLTMPIPTEGFWVDYREARFATAVHQCTRNTCKGAAKENSNSRTTAQKCWNLVNFTKSSGDCRYDDLLCTKGSRDVLCGSCDDGFYFSATSNTCERCSGSMVNTWIFVLGVGAGSALYLAARKGYVAVPGWISSLWIVGMVRNIDSGCFKVLFSSYQIIQSVSFTMDVVFPSPFSGLLNFMSFISFDISTLECSPLGGERVYTAVYIYSTAPLIVAMIIVIVGILRAFVLLPVMQRAEVMAQHSWALLLLSYLVMPPVTTKQFQALNCFELDHDDKSSWLRQDTSIKCNEPEHEKFTVINAFLILLYMLIPILWVVLLQRVRHRLVPEGVVDEALVVEMRTKDTHLSSLSFLFRDYKVHYWYWEALEMLRRVLFCGVIPLMATGTFERGLIGLMLSLASIVTYREVMPFQNRFASTLGHGAQIVIFIVFGAAVAIEGNVNVDPFLLGTLLCVVTIGIVASAAAASLSRHLRKQRLARSKREASVQKIEWACHFSATKFHTTFEKITETAIPPSHALVFFYSSIARVKKIIRSGIRVDEDSDGVIVTLSQPHELTDMEDTLFPCQEGFVACSVLKESLVPFAAENATSSLRIIPAGFLTAMRGSYFGDLVDPTPWLQGHSLLPPHCIVRAYQLEEKVQEDDDNDEESDNDQNMSNTRKGSAASRLNWSISGLANGSFGDVELALFSSDRRSQTCTYDDGQLLLHEVSTPRSVDEFLGSMAKIRSKCEEMGWFPLYHYTVPAVAPFILKGGFRMSTQGQGDGGVYFSTLGPASYDLGTPKYEENIIVDCFGRERLEEYRGKHKLDVCLVYGAHPSILQQAPGGRENAKMVGKQFFETFSLPQSDGNYFLRPDRILGAFLLDPAQAILGGDGAANREAMKVEKDKDKAVKDSLSGVQETMMMYRKGTEAQQKSAAIRREKSNTPVGIEKETGDLFVEDDDGNGGFASDMHACMEDRRTSAAKEFTENPMQAFQAQGMARGLTTDDRPRAPSSHGGDPLRSAAAGVSADARDSDRPAMIQARSSQLTRRLLAMRGSNEEVGTSVTSKTPDGDDITQWMEYLDNASGNKYWHNTTTGETIWQSPESTKEDRKQRKSAVL